MPTDLASGPKYGVRASFRSRLAAALSLTTGIDALASLSSLEREGSPTLPPREGDINVFGQPPGSDYTADSWRTSITNVGPYAHAGVKFGPLTATPGVRADAFLIEGDRNTPRAGRAPGLGFSRLETAIAPRFKARWEVTPRVSFYATYGTYHQAPEPEDLSAVFGTPDLALERATHMTLGESLRITPTLSADVVAFKSTAVLTTSNPRPATMASSGYAVIQCFVPSKIGV